MEDLCHYGILLPGNAGDFGRCARDDSVIAAVAPHDVHPDGVSDRDVELHRVDGPGGRAFDGERVRAARVDEKCLIEREQLLLHRIEDVAGAILHVERAREVTALVFEEIGRDHERAAERRLGEPHA